MKVKAIKVFFKLFKTKSVHRDWKYCFYSVTKGHYLVGPSVSGWDTHFFEAKVSEGISHL